MNTNPSDSHASIRLATERDIERILEIDRLSFEKQWQWDYEKFKAALNELFLVFEEKEILGFLSACCIELANQAIIMKVAVHPDHRGEGIGTKLIDAVLGEFKRRKIREIELHVEIVRTGAIKLYEKFGFKIMKVLYADYEEEESFYMMKLKLPNEGHGRAA